jgi:hypothetical protein
MKRLTFLLLAGCAAALLLPRPARADDPFAEYRIPDHSWTSGSASLSTTANQGIQQFSGRYESHELNGSGSVYVERGYDSDPLYWWLSTSVGGRAAVRSVSYRPYPEYDRQDHIADALEQWYVSGATRFYPGPGPLGFLASATLSAYYDQSWSRADLYRDAGLGWRDQQRDFDRSDYHALNLTARVGPVWGRVRDATPVYSVHVLEQRLIEAGALAGPLTAKARERLAAVIAAGNEIGAAHERPGRFLWREVERVLREEGAIGEGGLGAYATLRASEYTQPRGRFQRQRGRLFGPVLTARAGSSVTRGQSESEWRVFVADTLYLDDRTVVQVPVYRSTVDQYWAGVQGECHQPLGWSWQLDLSGAVEAETRVGQHGYRCESAATLGWDIADRWAAQAGWSQERNNARPDVLEPAWVAQAGVSLAWFVEDRTSLSLSVNEMQERWSDTFYRQRQATIGLAYRFLGSFSAPGLMEPMHRLR